MQVRLCSVRAVYVHSVVGNVRQTGRVVEIFAEDREERKEVLRTGDKGFMKFRYAGLHKHTPLTNYLDSYTSLLYT